MSSIPAELAPPVLPKRRQTVIGAALAAELGLVHQVR